MEKLIGCIVQLAANVAPTFDKKKDGKSAIAVDVCCLETPCDGQSGGGGGGGGVQSVTSGNTDTITTERTPEMPKNDIILASASSSLFSIR